MKLWPIIVLSWKNVWRNKVRSIVVMASVILGVWAAIFTTAFMNGMTTQLINLQLENVVSHIQIHSVAYDEERISSATIANADSVLQHIESQPFVNHVTSRIVVDALISSATSNFGVTAKGIDPVSEMKTTNVHEYVIEGTYIDSTTRNGILIGTKLAKRLQIGLNSRVVLNTQDIEGHLTAGAFRVSGIFHSPDANLNERMIFVAKEDIGALILDTTAVHEIAIITDDPKQADAYVQQLSIFDDLVVKSWGDISPALRYSDSATGTVLYIFMIIIVIALCFGIVNTMLMAVLERTPEIGMLMAIGLGKFSAFLMIMFETIFLTLVGAPIGMALSALSIALLADTGIDLSAFAQGLEMYGISSIVYPVLEGWFYLGIAIIISIASLIAALFPSLKALRLNPVQAIRKL